MVKETRGILDAGLAEEYGRGFRGHFRPVQRFIDGTVYFKAISGQGETWLKMPIDLFNVSFLFTASNYVVLNFPQYLSIWNNMLPLAVGCWIVSVFTLGRIIDSKYKPIEAQANFSNERNPALKRIEDNILKIGKQLKNG